MHSLTNDKEDMKKVVFFIFHTDYRELEWIMPLISGYKTRGINVSVVLPRFAKTQRQKLMLAWLMNYKVDLIYRYDIVHKASAYLKSLCIKAEDNKSFLSLLVRLFMEPGNYIARHSPLKYVHRFLIRKNFKKILFDVDAVFLPEIIGVKSLPHNSYPDIVVNNIKKLEIPTIGYLTFISNVARKVNIVKIKKENMNKSVLEYFNNS